jgi:hypothetical protein
VAREGQGRSGGFRTIIVYRAKAIAFFIYGFAKSEQDNIEDADFKLLKAAAATYLSFEESEIRKLSEDGILFEVHRNG